MVQTYTEYAKQIAKKVTGSDISELDAIKLAGELIEEDQKHHIKPIMRVFLGGAATPDTEDYKKRDEQGRVILQLIGNTVYETRYDHRPDAKHPQMTSVWHINDQHAKKTIPILLHGQWQ